ncbi:hypothetical protein FACS1894187_18720 [Synergistales bacterium]|nr:hypothetical protein FACS1894187_18720 [Synergistales bacterium]
MNEYIKECTKERERKELSDKIVESAKVIWQNGGSGAGESRDFGRLADEERELEKLYTQLRRESLAKAIDGLSLSSFEKMTLFAELYNDSFCIASRENWNKAQEEDIPF